MAETSQETLRRYMAIPAEQRLKVVEDNLIALVNNLLQEQPPEVNVVLPVPAVLLDIVRVLRQLSGDHSTEQKVEAVESPPHLEVVQLPLEGNV